MSDEYDWDFHGAEDAKAETRAAIGYLLKGAASSARSDIVRDIIEIVRQAANGLSPELQNPLDEDCRRLTSSPTSEETAGESGNCGDSYA